MHLRPIVFRSCRLIAALAAAALAVAGCGGGSHSNSATQASATAAAATTPESSIPSGGKLTYAITQYPADFNPHESYDTDAVIIWRAWWEYLVRPTQSGAGFEPQLAKSWTVSRDSRTYTFHLRPDVTFTNGEPMNAKDVIWSLNQAIASQAGNLTFLKPLISSMTAPDPLTVRVQLKQPWPYLLGDVCCHMSVILPMHLIQHEGMKAYLQHPIGTGPFELQRFDPGNAVYVTRNPQYWRAGYPKLDAITFKVYTDDQARVDAVIGGQAQLADNPPPNQLASLKSNSQVRVLTFPYSRMDPIVLNTHVAPLGNELVRRAISLAIDRAAIVKVGLFGYGKPANTFLVGPSALTYQDTASNYYPYDPTEAKKLLARSGVKLPINLNLTVSQSTIQTVIAEIVKANLQQIGIKVNIVRGELATTDNDINLDRFQMSTTNWEDYSPDPSVQPEFAIDPAYCCNAYFSYYKNPTDVALLHKALAASSSTTRRQLFDQVQQRMAQAAYLLPLFFPSQSFVVSPKLAGFFAYPNNFMAFEDWGLLK
jgi:peptide/nickel transport system substrate-binding protein